VTQGLVNAKIPAKPNVNLEMIKAGYAEVYSGAPPKGFVLREYQDADVLAKNAGSGMWAQGDKYISPAQWRKSQM